MPMYDREGEVTRKTEKFQGVSAKVMLSLHKWRTKLKSSIGVTGKH
jgi:hypothetical protein